MKAKQKLLTQLMGPLAIGGIAWCLTTARPLQAQNTGLAAPPEVETANRQPREAHRPRRGEGHGPDGRDEGPGPGFGPPPPFGPHPEMGHGGPPGSGPRGRDHSGRRPGGRDHYGRGPGEHRPGEYRAGLGGPGERGPGGPGPRRHGPRGSAIGRAAHSIADVDIFGDLTGDAFNVSGQAREFYRRALAARKEGRADDAARLATVSDELARAAVRLAEVQTGTKLPELMGEPGFDGPGFNEPGPAEPRPRRQGEGREPDAARRREHAGHILTGAYRMLGETQGRWNETARKLYSGARADYDGGRYDQAIGTAHAVIHLVQAGEAAREGERK